jgi:hypothetical protein
MDVGMELARPLAIGRGDLVVGRPWEHAEHVEGIHPFCLSTR